jgi:hypothetical protein
MDNDIYDWKQPYILTEWLGPRHLFLNTLSSLLASSQGLTVEPERVREVTSPYVTEPFRLPPSHIMAMRVRTSSLTGVWSVICVPGYPHCFWDALGSGASRCIPQA